MLASLQRAGFTIFCRHRQSIQALTLLVSSLPLSEDEGGLVSVALSLESPPVAVSDCPSLCCPDFPRMPYRHSRSADNLASLNYIIYRWRINKIGYTTSVNIIFDYKNIGVWRSW